MNQETKSAEEIERVELKRGIALVRINARAQKIVPIPSHRDPGTLRVSIVFMLDFHESKTLNEDEFDGGMTEDQRRTEEGRYQDTVRNLGRDDRCGSQRRARGVLASQGV